MRVFSIMIFLFFLAAPFAWSHEGMVHTQSEAVQAGDRFCPVTGDKVSGKHFVEYKGKRYAMCCPMCEKKFKKNPEKYIAKLKG